MSEGISQEDYEKFFKDVTVKNDQAETLGAHHVYEDLNNYILRVGQFEKVSRTSFGNVLVGIDSSLRFGDMEFVYDNIQLPKRSTSGSCGYDFFFPYKEWLLAPGASIAIPTGIKVKIAPGWSFDIYPRSSLGCKGIGIANTVGLIDSDYYNNEKNEGHIIVNLYNRGKDIIELKRGDKFCQGKFTPFGITYDDNAVGKRVGGIGSTGV